MKPNPLVALNHLTVPVAIISIPWWSARVRGGHASGIRATDPFEPLFVSSGALQTGATVAAPAARRQNRRGGVRRRQGVQLIEKRIRPAPRVISTWSPTFCGRKSDDC